MYVNHDLSTLFKNKDILNKIQSEFIDMLPEHRVDELLQKLTNHKQKLEEKKKHNAKKLEQIEILQNEMTMIVNKHRDILPTSTKEFLLNIHKVAKDFIEKNYD